MELGTLDGIIGCVSIGLGSTLMPRWVVEQSRYSDELMVEPIESQLALVPTMMVRHRLGTSLAALDTLEQAVAAQAKAA